jgi:hypothetical protein
MNRYHDIFWVLLLALSLPASVAAVPLQVTQQGRLIDADGDALTGSHTIHFSLFANDNGTGEQWTESQTVSLDEGYYSVILGGENGTTLDDSVLSLQPLYLGMSVDDGALMMPLLEVTSAPYAIVAGSATNLSGGFVDSSSMYINGDLVVDGNGDWVGNVLPGTLESLGCADGEEARYSDTTGWACAHPGEHFTAAEAVNAMGTEGAANPLNHSRYTAAEALADLGPHYTNSEAVSAVSAADLYVENDGDTMTGTLRMQANGPSILFDDTSSAGSLGAEWELRAGSSNFEINRPSLGSTSTNNLRIVPGSSGSIQLRPNNHTTLTAQADGNVVVDEHVFSERYAFSARTASSALYPSTTPTVDGWRVPFTELQDNGSVFSGSSFTVPRTGYYSLSMSFAFEGGDGGSDEWRVAFTQRSPGDISSSVIQSLYCNPRYQSRSSRRVSNASLTTVARLIQGDTISIRISSISSSSDDVFIRRGYFSGFYLGD